MALNSISGGSHAGPSTQVTPAQTQTPTNNARESSPSLSREIAGAPASFARAPQSTSSGTRRASLPQIASAETPTATPVETSEARNAREQGVRTAVSGYFMRHAPDGDDESHAALRALVDDRVQGLMEMGETAESIAATFSKARQHDIAAEGARGFVGSIPFGIASRLLDTQPAIGETVVSGLNALPGIKNTPDAFKGGLAGGLVSGVADHIGTEALTPAMKDVQWLASSAEHLDPSMAAAKRRAEGGMGRAVAQNAAAIQTFTARNVIRGVVGPAITAAGASATQTDSWLAAIGSPLSGAGFNVVSRHFAERDHRVGPEYLLGRNDWREQYQALKGATWKGAIANGTGRVAKAVVNTVDAALSAPRTILSAPSIASNVGALGFGLGAVSMATSSAGALAKKLGANAAGVVAAEHAGRTLSSAPVFASWTTAAIVTQPAVDALRGASNATGDAVQNGVSGAVHKSAETIGNKAQQSADYAGPKLRSARDATIRNGQRALEGASTAFNDARTATGHALSNAGSAVSTGFSNAGTRLGAMVGSASNSVGQTVTNLRNRARPSAPQGEAQNAPGATAGDIELGHVNVPAAGS